MTEAPRITLVQLQRFLAVAEELHFTRAATRLRVSQPLLSAQMRDLEETLGVRLFERTSRKVQLSDAGILFMKRAQAILNAARDAVAATQEVAHGRKAPIRIGYTDEFSRYIVPDLVAFLKQEAAAVVELKPGAVPQLIAALTDGTLDLALLCPLPTSIDPGWFLQPLPDARLVVGLRNDHPLAGERSLTVEQIADQPFVASTVRESGSELFADRLFAEKSVTRRIAQRCGDPHMMNSLAAAGVGILLATRADFMPYPELAAIPLNPPVRLRRGAVSRASSQGMLLDRSREWLSNLAIS